MSDIEVIKTLSGHSGCTVQLCRRGGFHFVRKFSGSIGYNVRLLHQIDKQSRLSTIIDVPKVITSGTFGDLAYFEMEYVTGNDFLTQCLSERMTWFLVVLDKMFEMLDCLARTVRSGDIEPAFVAKLAQIKSAVAKNEFYLAEPASTDQALNYAALQSWKGIPVTECHGDLTIENIIFRESGSLTFIDLLDGELESFWLDIAKVLMDLRLGWSLRNVLWAQGVDPERKLLSMISRYLADELIVKITRNHPLIMPYLKQLQVLQALRILPYVRDRQTFTRISSYLDELTANEKGSNHA